MLNMRSEINLIIHKIILITKLLITLSNLPNLNYIKILILNKESYLILL